MTIRDTELQAIKKLKRASGRGAAIEAEILLSHALGITREKLLTHNNRQMPPFALKRFNTFVARRGKHEPIAYITGHKEFFGLLFFVDKNVLIPRPETELLVEEALNALRATGQALVVDVGTGSGAIAVAVAKNSNATIIATDISPAALKVASRNAALNEVQEQIIFKRTNLLPKKIKIPASAIITANLPYLPITVWKKCALDVKKFEPKTALVGGKDGLKYYDELFHQIAAILPSLEGRGDTRRERARPLTSQDGKNRRAEPLTIICEIDPSQKKSFPKLVKKHFPKANVQIKNDLAHLARVAIITLF